MIGSHTPRLRHCKIGYGKFGNYRGTESIIKTAFEGLICRLGAKIRADRRTKGEGRHAEAPEGLEQAPRGVGGGGDGACAGGRLPYIENA